MVRMRNILTGAARIALFLVLGLFVAACDNSTSKRDAKSTETVKSASIQQVTDLQEIQAALKKYHDAKGAYPVSSMNGKGWDGYKTLWGQASPEWIADLKPAFMAALPHEPRDYADGNLQYLYISDGKDYKLVYHNVALQHKMMDSDPVLDAVRKTRPELIDPVRPQIAFGFWSAGAAAW